MRAEGSDSGSSTALAAAASAPRYAVPPCAESRAAALAQRVQRPLARADDALRPDGAVELVLDLQEARRELAVVAVAVADADRLVRRVGLGEHVVQASGVALDAVVAHRERILRFAQ